MGEIEYREEIGNNVHRMSRLQKSSARGNASLTRSARRFIVARDPRAKIWKRGSQQIGIVDLSPKALRAAGVLDGRETIRQSGGELSFARVFDGSYDVLARRIQPRRHPFPCFTVPYGAGHELSRGFWICGTAQEANNVNPCASLSRLPFRF